MGQIEEHKRPWQKVCPVVRRYETSPPHRVSCAAEDNLLLTINKNIAFNPGEDEWVCLSVWSSEKEAELSVRGLAASDSGPATAADKKNRLSYANLLGPHRDWKRIMHCSRTMQTC